MQKPSCCSTAPRRSGVAFGLALWALVVVTGCSDAASPLEPADAPAPAGVAVTSPVLSGSYESRERVALSGGRSIYLVSVAFGDGAKADGRTYIAQAGVQSGAGATLVIAQKTYTVTADSVRFDGVLQRGLISGDSVLTALASVDGEQFQVRLRRR